MIHRQETEANMNKEEKISEANVDAESIQNTKEAVKKKSKFSLKPIKKKRSASKSLVCSLTPGLKLFHNLS